MELEIITATDLNNSADELDRGVGEGIGDGYGVGYYIGKGISLDTGDGGGSGEGHCGNVVSTPNFKDSDKGNGGRDVLSEINGNGSDDE